MIFEETVVAKLHQVPENKREKLLHLLDEWIEQNHVGSNDNIQFAVASVQNSWATLHLDEPTLKWVAEDKELEYEFG